MKYLVTHIDGTTRTVDAVTPLGAKLKAIDEARGENFRRTDIDFETYCRKINIRNVERLGHEEPHEHQLHQLADDGCPHHD